MNRVGSQLRDMGVAAFLVAAGLGCREPSPEALSPDLRVDASLLHAQAPAARAFRDAAETAMPGLVFVQVEAVPVAIRDLGGQPPPSRLQEPPEAAQVGSGSGFLLTPEGHVLTNNHVVQDAVSVTVVLRDNRRFEAAVVGRDPDTDIAVLKVDADSLRPAILGDSDSLGVGDWVLALGYPLGLSLTGTAGIVSGTGRSIGITERNAEAVAVDRYSPAARACLRPGQRIVALNRRAVRTGAEFEAVLRELPQPGVLSLRVADPEFGETIINYELEPSHRAR